MDRNASLRDTLTCEAHPLTEIDKQSLPQQIAIKGNTRSTTALNYEYRLADPSHLARISQIARKQTRGSTVDWQDALQTAQLKLIVSIRAGKFTYGTEQDFDRWAMAVTRFEIIDLVRKSKCREWESLDRPLADNLTLLDTIADPLNSFTTVEIADLVIQVKTAIINLDRLYPDRSYYQLWLGKVNEQTQAEIARGLGLTQSAISKRWQELLCRLTIELGLDSLPNVDRTRSSQQW
jgi:RNA polymerase sigma factor (sigma-70 family)